MKLSDLSEKAKTDVAKTTYQVLGDPRTPAAAPPGAAPVRPGETRVPDFAGWPEREAVKTLLGLGLVPSVEGTGRLSHQEPPAGSVLPKGSSVKLVFEPST